MSVCPECGGRPLEGEEQPGDRCAVCNNTGEVEVVRVKCEQCDGCGLEIVCPECHGNPSPYPDSRCERCRNEGGVTCTNCYGEGYIIVVDTADL